MTTNRNDDSVAITFDVKIFNNYLVTFKIRRCKDKTLVNLTNRNDDSVQINFD